MGERVDAKVPLHTNIRGIGSRGLKVFVEEGIVRPVLFVVVGASGGIARNVRGGVLRALSGPSRMLPGCSCLVAITTKKWVEQEKGTDVGIRGWSMILVESN